VDPSLVVSCFGLGSALLGFWAVARFPGLGPQRVASAIVLVAAAFVAESPLLALARPVIERAGVAEGLILVVLPSLTLLFWTSGCLVRSLVALTSPYRR